jgi:hypothetical protein
MMSLAPGGGGFLAPLTRSQIAALGENCRRLSAAVKASGATGRIGRP